MPVYLSDLPECPEPGVSLYCPKCDEHFSATRGDYFMLKPNHKFRCGEHRPLVDLQLVRKVETLEVIK